MSDIHDTIFAATLEVEAYENQADYPVPGDFEASVYKLVYEKGVETMREAAVRNLRVQGFNIHACQTLDLKV